MLQQPRNGGVAIVPTRWCGGYRVLTWAGCIVCAVTGWPGLRALAAGDQSLQTNAVRLVVTPPDSSNGVSLSQRKGTVIGSGALFKADNEVYLATAYHVIHGSARIEVFYEEKSKGDLGPLISAKKDHQSFYSSGDWDLAVFPVQAEEFGRVTAVLARDELIRPGRVASAFGNSVTQSYEEPGTLASLVTLVAIRGFRGIVADRMYENNATRSESLFQFESISVRPGFSGGPVLVNSDTDQPELVTVIQGGTLGVKIDEGRVTFGPRTKVIRDAVSAIRQAQPGPNELTDLKVVLADPQKWPAPKFKSGYLLAPRTVLLYDGGPEGAECRQDQQGKLLYVRNADSENGREPASINAQLTKFTGASLHFEHVNFMDVDFSEIYTVNAIFHECAFDECDFSRAILNGASFDDCTFRKNSALIHKSSALQTNGTQVRYSRGKQDHRFHEFEERADVPQLKDAVSRLARQQQELLKSADDPEGVLNNRWQMTMASVELELVAAQLESQAPRADWEPVLNSGLDRISRIESGALTGADVPTYREIDLLRWDLLKRLVLQSKPVLAIPVGAATGIPVGQRPAGHAGKPPTNVAPLRPAQPSKAPCCTTPKIPATRNFPRTTTQRAR